MNKTNGEFMEKTHVVTVNVPNSYLDGLDALIRRGIIPHRSEGIRIAIRDYLKVEQ